MTSKLPPSRSRRSPPTLHRPTVAQVAQAMQQDLPDLIFATGTHWRDRSVRFWLGLSLGFSLIFSVWALTESLGAAYIIQDDARQHVFWMLRYWDPELLPDDLIADYFQSVAPLGYRALYRVFAALGIHPYFFNRLLPTAIGLVTTGYCFGFSLQVLARPAAAFLGTLLLNQSLWLRDDIVSGTPRAFVYALLLAFLYYFARRQLWPCLAVLVLQPLFYPQCALLSAGVLVLSAVSVQNGRLRLFARAGDGRFIGLCLGMILLCLLPFALSVSAFEPVVTPAIAQTMPEFWSGGRVRFFNPDRLDFWLGRRSGLFPHPFLTPVTLVPGLLLPLLLARSRWVPLATTVRAHSGLLLRLLLASLGLFLLAHGLLFQLHLPGRYTHYSLRILFAIAAALVWIMALEGLWGWAQRGRWRRSLALILTTVVAGGMLGYPLLLDSYLHPYYRPGYRSDLYEFLHEAPQDARVATLSLANDVLVFGRRTVLISKEHAIPYHLGYYRHHQQRLLDLLAAQYSPDRDTVLQFIERYDIDFWLLDANAFSANYIRGNRFIRNFYEAAAHPVPPKFRENEWLLQLRDVADEAIEHLSSDRPPVLQRAIPACTVLQEDDEYLLLQTDCITQFQVASSAPASPKTPAARPRT